MYYALHSVEHDWTRPLYQPIICEYNPVGVHAEAIGPPSFSRFNSQAGSMSSNVKMMDLFRIPSIKRRKRRDTITTTPSPQLRASTSLPELKNTTQPFFIPNDAFDLARLRATAKTALCAEDKTPSNRPQSSRHNSAPFPRGQPDTNDSHSPFERIRPISSATRRSSTFSNTRRSGSEQDRLIHLGKRLVYLHS